MIGLTNYPTTHELVLTKLTLDWPQITDVRGLGSYKFLATFDKEESRIVALKEYEPLLMQYFTEIIPQSHYEAVETRRTWIEFHGIPPQVGLWNLQKSLFIVFVACVQCVIKCHCNTALSL